MQDDSRVRPPSRPAQLAQLLFVSLSLMEEVCRRADTAEPMRAEKTSTRYSEVKKQYGFRTSHMTVVRRTRPRNSYCTRAVSLCMYVAGAKYGGGRHPLALPPILCWLNLPGLPDGDASC
jgi:hypothetical protein